MLTINPLYKKGIHVPKAKILLLLANVIQNRCPKLNAIYTKSHVLFSTYGSPSFKNHKHLLKMKVLLSISYNYHLANFTFIWREKLAYTYILVNHKTRIHESTPRCKYWLLFLFIFWIPSYCLIIRKKYYSISFYFGQQ